MTSGLHISTSDIGGGAAIAAHRLHQGLQRVGVNSKMLVRSKTSTDPAISESLHIKGLLARTKRRVSFEALKLERWRDKGTLSPTLELFSDDRVPGANFLFPPAPEADVLNLHWVAGFVDYRRFFERLPPYFPLVWTLHDMAPFTGGCHYTLGCGAFSSACGSCPQLGSSRTGDLSARILKRKRAAISELAPETTRIVSPSSWLAAEARRSSMFKGFSVEVIPHGLDVEIFKPLDKRTAREVLGLPLDAKVILFAADGVKNNRKGYDLLLEALAQFQGSPAPFLVSLGGGAAPGMAANVCALGHISSPRLMALAYSSADVFVAPSRAEAFGQVALEAMACGVPVVAFDVGGLPDMVRPGITGLLAPPEDVGALSRAIEAMLGNDDLRGRMSAECRRVAVAEFSLEMQANRYKALYESLIEASKSKLKRPA